jgi:hypothetical protein
MYDLLIAIIIGLGLVPLGMLAGWTIVWLMAKCFKAMRKLFL